MIHAWKGILPEIHPTAWVHPDATVIGEVFIGPRASVWPGTVIRGDMGPIYIGADSNVQDNSTVHNTGGKSVTRIGERVTVGHRAVIHGAIVGDDVLVGMGSVLLDNCTIGSWTVIGAASLIAMRKEMPSGVLVLGSPGVPVRDLRDADREWITYSWRVYVETAAEYRNAGIGSP